MRIVFEAMNCGMLAITDARSARTRRALGRVPGWFAAWEQTLSRFRAESELSRLNASPGQLVAASPTLLRVVGVALWAARASDGLVAPTLLAALEAAGYDRDFDELRDRDGQRGTAAEEPPGREAAGVAASTRATRGTGAPSGAGGPVPPCHAAWRAIVCDLGARRLGLPPGARMDLGGVAKGWAADVAARRLGRHGPALVDASGDLAASAPPRGRPGGPIAIEDPSRAGRPLPLLCLRRGGVATSGRDHRRWRRGGVWQHHILDPRTGRPAETDVLSATVVARSAVEAEVAAKVALILGSGAGLAWIEQRPRLAALLVLEDGQVLASRRFDRCTWS